MAAVVEDALDRHAANPHLAPFLRWLDLPQLKALAMVFLSAIAGGPRDGGVPGLEPWQSLRRHGPGVLGRCVVMSRHQRGTIQERGLFSLHIRGSDGGPV